MFGKIAAILILFGNMLKKVRKLSLSLIFVAAAAVVLYAIIIRHLEPRIISVQTVQNLGLVTFSDGNTHVIFHDYDYASMGTGWDVSTIIPAVSADQGRQLPLLVAPQVTFRGSNWQREIYTYANTWDGCQNMILYINREAKSYEVIKKVSTDYCISQVLDKNDFTQFMGISPDNSTLAIGRFIDGKIIASVELPIIGGVPGGVSGVVSNWENTKLAFFSGGCDLNGDTLQLLIWDTTTGSLIDHRASLHTSDCSPISYIVYNRGTDSFDVYNNNFGNNSESLYVGTIK